MTAIFLRVALSRGDAGEGFPISRDDEMAALPERLFIAHPPDFLLELPQLPLLPDNLGILTIGDLTFAI